MPSDSVSPESPKAAAWHIANERGAVLYGDATGGSTLVGVVKYWRCGPDRDAAIDAAQALIRAALAARDRQGEPLCRCGHGRSVHAYPWDAEPEDGMPCDSEDCACGAYEPGVSDIPEPPAAVQHYVSLNDGTVWPVNVGEIEWRLRYGELSKTDRLIAASVLGAYSAMTDQTLRSASAEAKLHRARQAQREAS